MGKPTALPASSWQESSSPQGSCAVNSITHETIWAKTHITRSDKLYLPIGLEIIKVDMVAKSPFMAFCSTESEKRRFHFPHKSTTCVAHH